MENETIKLTLSKLFPNAIFKEGGEWLNVLIVSEEWFKLASFLRGNSTLSFDYLFCLTCIDWTSHLTMVYHLSSTRFRHNIVVKSSLDSKNPTIESVSHIWKTASFHEREVYEMFGVFFKNHEDLRLLILPDGWEGKNPLRKDFEDPINMIIL